MTSLPLSSASTPSIWRLPLVATVAAVLLILLAYQGTAQAIVEIWSRAQTYNHGFVVLPIALWLVWRKRAVLAAIDPAPAPWVLLPVAGLAALWWVGQLVNVAAAMQFALVAMVALVVPLVLGLRVARAITFPLCFLLFAVPVGDFMVPALMHWTAEALVASLRLTGLPVYQEGQLLVIPSGRWAVVEACGGIRYLLATFMVGCLFAYLNYRSVTRRTVFMVVSLIVPVVANWVRAYLIVMLGHLSDNKYGTGDDHLVYGWGFFGVVILALFFIGARWAEPDDLPPVVGAAAPVAASTARSPSWVPALAALALAAATWPVWLGAALDQAADRSAVRIDMPATMGGWRAEAASPGDWSPAFLKPAGEQTRVYRQADAAVAVHVNYYRGRADDSKLVSSSNRLLGANSRWHVVSRRVVQVGAAGNMHVWDSALLLPVDSSDTVGATNRQRLTVWQLYWIDGRTFRSDAHAKLSQAWLAVRGQSDEGAAIHLVSTRSDPEDAHAELSRFVAENFSMIDRTLAQTRAER